MGQFQNQSGQQFKDAEQAKKFAKEHEGEVKINKNQKSSSIDDGEFVDYEEID